MTPTTLPASNRRRWAALTVLMLPVLLVAVDNTVLSFALPQISKALAPSGTEQLWIVDIYPLVLAGLLVPMGSLGDRFGRRRLLLVGSTGFAIISALAAFAPTAELLIAARAAMGIFGAMIMPATLSLIRNIFTDDDERRRAIAIWAAAFSGGAALGPMLGGFLLAHFWWGSVFLLAIPMLVPLLALGTLLVPESRDPKPGPIDPLSIVLVMATMTPTVWAIKQIAEEGFTLAVIAALVIGVLAGVVFVRRQLHRPEPMLDVGLFTLPQFSGAVVANLLSIFSLVGALFFMSQHLQLVSGLSPIRAGLVLLPGSVVTVVAGLLAVRAVRRFRPAVVVAGGLLLNALGYLTMMIGTDAGLVAAFVLLGAGVGFAETISNDLILATAPAEKAGAASAISETAYETGAVLGTTVLGSLLNAFYRAHLTLPAGLTQAQALEANQTLGGATAVAAGLPTDLAEPLLASARAAFDSGSILTAAIGAGLMVFAAWLTMRTLGRVR